MAELNAQQVLEEFIDRISPRLNTYEQAVYLYVLRHSRLKGLDSAVIALKSERTRIAFGIGQEGTPMSESSAYKNLQSLAAKGCIEIIKTEHKGKRIRALLPTEMNGFAVPTADIPDVDIEEMDFFEDAGNRLAIFHRENGRCFYTLRTLDETTFVIDHVVSRPEGSNNYRNVVAASREANNRKGAKTAEEF
jgi:hypothetical protein